VKWIVKGRVREEMGSSKEGKEKRHSLGSINFIQVRTTSECREKVLEREKKVGGLIGGQRCRTDYDQS